MAQRVSCQRNGSLQQIIQETFLGSVTVMAGVFHPGFDMSRNKK